MDRAEHLQGVDRARTLRRRAGIVAGLALGGALLALASGLLLDNRYEATALVRIGHLAQLGQPGARTESRPIEEASQAAERVKAPSFLAATRLGDPAEAGTDVVPRLFVRRVKDSQMLEVRYQAAAPEAAAQGLSTIVELLRRRHDDMAQPGRDTIGEQLRTVQALRAELLTARAGVAQSAKTIVLEPVKHEFLLQLALVGQYSELAQWEAALQAAMQPPFTFSTSLVEPISVGSDPVSPNRVMLVIAGLLAGLMGGVGLIMAGQLWQRMRTGP